MKKVEYDLELLHKQVYEDKLPYLQIGKYYGVTDGAIIKKLHSLGWELPKRRRYSEEERIKRNARPLIERHCLYCGKLLIGQASWTNTYCSQQCANLYRHKLQYQKIIDGDPSIMRGNYDPSYFKMDILKEQNGVCDICGMPPEWQGKPLVFILDHIDGHASNNKRSNLRCICPNCDSQLDTYKRKNKKSDRITRYYPNSLR